LGRGGLGPFLKEREEKKKKELSTVPDRGKGVGSFYMKTRGNESTMMRKGGKKIHFYNYKGKNHSTKQFRMRESGQEVFLEKGREDSTYLRREEEETLFQDVKDESGGKNRKVGSEKKKGGRGKEEKHSQPFCWLLAEGKKKEVPCVVFGVRRVKTEGDRQRGRENLSSICGRQGAKKKKTPNLLLFNRGKKNPRIGKKEKREKGALPCRKKTKRRKKKRRFRHCTKLPPGKEEEVSGRIGKEKRGKGKKEGFCLVQQMEKKGRREHPLFLEKGRGL